MKAGDRVFVKNNLNYKGDWYKKVNFMQVHTLIKQIDPDMVMVKTNIGIHYYSVNDVYPDTYNFIKDL